MIHAPAGQDLTFSVTNDGTAQHTFAIDTGGELIETPELQPGETQALEVPALDGGDHAPVDRRDEAAREEHELQSAPPLRLRPAPRHGDKEQVRPLMTLILAIRCADGLVLASDGQSTVGTAGQPVKTETEKLVVPWTGIAWGGSGRVSMIQAVERALTHDFSARTALDKKTPKDAIVALGNCVGKAVRDVLQGGYVQLPQNDNPSSPFLFAGETPQGPFLLEDHPNTTFTDHVVTGYAAIGSGDIFPYFALTGLRHYGVANRSMLEAKLIAVRILDDVIHSAAFGIGPPIHVVEVQRQADACGVAKILDRADVQALVDKVTEWKTAEAEFLTEFVGAPVAPVAPSEEMTEAANEVPESA
jgi:proteasome beta subunit